jgi:hypothetical protein
VRERLEQLNFVASPKHRERQGAGLVKYDGYNGQIEVDDDELVITRDGLVARAAFGKDTPERRIPLQALSGVRLKEATRLKNGWVQLLLGGETPAELSAGTAASNANTVMFTHKKRSQFGELHDRLTAVVARNAEAGIDPAQAEWDQVSGQQGRFDKLASQELAPQERAEQKMEERKAKAEAAGLRPDIAEASARMGWKFGGKREIKNLEEHLYEGEQVTYLAQGTYEGNPGIVALTDQRLLFVFHGLMRQAVEDFPLDRLSSVQSKAGFASGDLTVHASGNSAVIKSIIKPDLKYLGDALRQRIGQGKSTSEASPPPPAPDAVVDVADQLAKFAALREQGILTEEEFAAQKAKLLGST